MNRAFELVDIIEDVETLLASLERFIERRNARSMKHEIVPEANIPDELRGYDCGNTYGRFHEAIVRREVRRKGCPEWFDPRKGPGQFGIVSGEYHVYFEVELDHVARAAPSTFDAKILDLVEVTPEQASLFG